MTTLQNLCVGCGNIITGKKRMVLKLFKQRWIHPKCLKKADKKGWYPATEDPKKIPSC